MGWIKRIYHPELFQGHHQKKTYFEGYYFKLVHPIEDHAIALIPGISYEKDGKGHAFIQLMDGTGGKSHYYHFPIEDFRSKEDDLFIAIGENVFSKEIIQLNLPDIQGELKLKNLHPLPKTWHSPGIMGWYSFVPFMQCYHGIVSMHHELTGTIIHEGRTFDYRGGVGYIEKDWGTSFPKCWFWTHANTFQSNEKVSVFASVAHIPWLGSYFPGFITNVMIDDRQLRFATYNGSKYSAEVSDDALHLTFKKGRLLCEITSIKAPGADLKSPIQGQMTGKVNESLQATIHLVLKEGDKTIWEGSSPHAGLEIAGDFDILLKE